MPTTQRASQSNIVKANELFVRHDLLRADARAMFDTRGGTCTVELLDRLASDAVVSCVHHR